MLRVNRAIHCKTHELTEVATADERGKVGDASACKLALSEQNIVQITALTIFQSESQLNKIL